MVSRSEFRLVERGRVWERRGGTGGGLSVSSRREGSFLGRGGTGGGLSNWVYSRVTGWGCNVGRCGCNMGGS